MGLIRRIKQKIKFEISKLVTPVMVGRFKRFDGEILQNTRISNSTYIGGYDKFMIEDNVFIGHHNFIDASNGITIGEGCQITNFISILTHSSHNSIRYYGKNYTNYNDLKGYIKGSVNIGKYTFIGPHSVIMPGTNIGKGCIISAMSFVKGEFPDFSIIKGNPAVVVGNTRDFDEKMISENPELRPNYNEWAENE